MKKIELHIDALAAVIILIAASLGFNFYQRYQYLDLLQEHISLQWRSLTTEFNLSSREASLKECEEENKQDERLEIGRE